MDPSEIEALVQRLVTNPHDEEALTYAHQAGAADPKAYALLLEKVGNMTMDPAYASHWLSEAANVWLQTLGDAHRAARVLMTAVDKDPTQQVAAERLAQLYRDKGNVRGLAALLDRRAKALAPLLAANPDLRTDVAAMHEELGRLWSEPPLSQPKKAIENFRRSIDLDPSNAYAIYSGRELLKSQGQFDEAYPLYDMELSIEQDNQRKIAILRDEGATRKQAGDLVGASRALARARKIDEQDPGLQQEYASTIVERVQAGDEVPQSERVLAAELLVVLAEAYDGEHGLAYAGAALDVEPGLDRALQLYAYYARAADREAELTPRYMAYIQQNPTGSLAVEARRALAAGFEAAGQFDEAIQMLEPLRGNDSVAEEKLGELYTQTAVPGPDGKPLVRPGGMKGSGENPGASLSMAATGANTLQRPSMGSSPTDGTSPAPPERGRNLMDPRVPAVTGTLASAVTGGSVSIDGETMAIGVAQQPSLVARRGPELPPDKLQGILDAAQMLAGKGKKPEALAKYKEVLDSDPAHAEALAWVEDYLRTKRDYAQLRDVLLASVRAMGSSSEVLENRRERLREVAGLCEGNLRDVDGAIAAWKQLLAMDRGDDSARQSLTRLLERTQRWDDLALLLEQEATSAPDIDVKIALEKKLANLNEQKRKDFSSAAEAWARIARLAPDDDRAIATSAKLFERAGRLDAATRVIAENAAQIEDPVARGTLLERLAELREQLGDVAGAGAAFADAAEAEGNARLWEHAERCFTAMENWERAATAAGQRGGLASDTKAQAGHFARASDLLTRAGDREGALQRLEQATDLDPTAEDYAAGLTERYTDNEQWDRLVFFFAKRGDRLVDKVKRVALRRQAAILYTVKLGDKEQSREQWLKVLEDGDDREALEKLIDYAVEREDHTEAATLLRRLGGIAIDKADRARVALREAELLAEGVGDVDTAIVRYESILSDLDPTCRPALQAIADLQEARDNPNAAADALERELKLVADPVERGQIAARLGRLYELVDDPRNAIRALDIVRKADLEDFDALTRLCELCERTEQWDRVAELLAQRIEIEGDPNEAGVMTKRLADILADRLDRGDEALAALTELADEGDVTLRDAYVELGDRLGWKGIVASKLVDWWFEARHGNDRTQALRGAFERFAELGRDQEATRVAIEIVRAKGADRNLAQKLEELAVKTTDIDALQVAHELLLRELSGLERASEMVRQAEMAVRAGVPSESAIEYGESGLFNIPMLDAEPLLDRLAELAEKPLEVIEMYERQVSRSRAPQDRMRALARAAAVATARNQIERGRQFLELALTGTPNEDTLGMLEQLAIHGDRRAGGEKLRRSLIQALAAGGGGARDGGRTRASLLRRAADLARAELGDIDHAFQLLGDALIAHVEPATLDAVEALGRAVLDPSRCDSTFSRALSEVFDGPLVRQLLARRARLRREELGDMPGAAADLKKLHDLSPNDHPVLEELSMLLRELGDYRGMVQLYEDQILRGRDMNARAELARKVARMWEEQLQDAREAADAWRRVLRMKAGDLEATNGLERAKKNALKPADPDAGPDTYAPPKASSVSGAPPGEPSVPPGRMGSAAPGRPSAMPTAASSPPPYNSIAPPPPPTAFPTPETRRSSVDTTTAVALGPASQNPDDTTGPTAVGEPRPHVHHQETTDDTGPGGPISLSRTSEEPIPDIPHEGFGHDTFSQNHDTFNAPDTTPGGYRDAPRTSAASADLVAAIRAAAHVPLAAPRAVRPNLEDDPTTNSMSDLPRSPFGPDLGDDEIAAALGLPHTSPSVELPTSIDVTEDGNTYTSPGPGTVRDANDRATQVGDDAPPSGESYPRFDQTLARPYKPDTGESQVPVDENTMADDDILVADDLAEMVDDDTKDSIPPLPR
jgi:tetratricopeptide (TPR) repeat protein